MLDVYNVLTSMGVNYPCPKLFHELLLLLSVLRCAKSFHRTAREKPTYHFVAAKTVQKKLNPRNMSFDIGIR